MSFLSELKSRANALQGLQLGAQRDLMAGTQACEQACRMALVYLQDLCAQLNVIQPPAPAAYSLDGKAPFAASAALVQRNFPLRRAPQDAAQCRGVRLHRRRLGLAARHRAGGDPHRHASTFRPTWSA